MLHYLVDVAHGLGHDLIAAIHDQTNISFDSARRVLGRLKMAEDGEQIPIPGATTGAMTER
jgi:hypothetical protein